jgi:pyridoxal phosphate enzyme (YggS family)
MTIAGSLSKLHIRLADAAQAAGRSPSSVRLMVVSKGVEAMRILEALEAGQRLFGENYVQEAKSKWPELIARYPDVELHLIGPLQTNKVKEALKIFHAIHTLDRPNLAETLAREAGRLAKVPALFAEVNSAAEPQKHGCTPQDLPPLLAQARALGLKVSGLMTVPPAGQDPAPPFRQLAALAKAEDLHELSMGMSGDFEEAIGCGATIIRIGTAIFGQRSAGRTY